LQYVEIVFAADTAQNWFTSLPGHDYFCEVYEDFIEDDFNLTGTSSRCFFVLGSPEQGLQPIVPFWKEALEMVLDCEPGQLASSTIALRDELTRKPEDSSKIPDVSIVETSAELLYGLVHQRFILTKAGLACMVRPSFTHPTPISY
jgi:casein kinase II subunit beta